MNVVLSFSLRQKKALSSLWGADSKNLKIKKGLGALKLMFIVLDTGYWIHAGYARDSCHHNKSALKGHWQNNVKVEADGTLNAIQVEAQCPRYCREVWDLHKKIMAHTQSYSVAVHVYHLCVWALAGAGTSYCNVYCILQLLPVRRHLHKGKNSLYSFMLHCWMHFCPFGSVPPVPACAPTDNNWRPASNWIFIYVCLNTLWGDLRPQSFETNCQGN